MADTGSVLDGVWILEEVYEYEGNIIRGIFRADVTPEQIMRWFCTKQNFPEFEWQTRYGLRYMEWDNVPYELQLWFARFDEI